MWFLGENGFRRRHRLRELVRTDGESVRTNRQSRFGSGDFLHNAGSVTTSSPVSVTVTPTAAASFRIVSGAATRQRDMAWLRRAARGKDVTLMDRTEEYCTIGVMGAASRRILGSLSRDAWQDFPFSTSRDVTLAGVPCWATRLSYAGELGWEITVSSNTATMVFDALIAAGARPMGHHALNGCRIEKGYRHWGHDLGPELTPLECGLGFAVDWSKDFQGKAVLEQQRRQGLTRRMVLLAVDGHPLILHDEPVFEAGNVVGATTSGAKGVRIGLTLALALVSVQRAETLAQTCQRQFTIEVAGTSYRAAALLKPPYDPTGQRMRA